MGVRVGMLGINAWFCIESTEASLDHVSTDSLHPSN